VYKAEIVADSISPAGCRLTTVEATYPLIIHAEIMTHRVFSRNVASNRAIPVKRLIEAVKTNPFIPEKFPKNQAGMQNSEWLEGHEAQDAKKLWINSSKSVLMYAEELQRIGVHKQITNRLLAPFLWTTAVITATEWNNFFTLRCDPAAQPEIQKIAYMIRDAYNASTPTPKKVGEWHLPYITDEDLSPKEKALASIGRCARVSYLTHGADNDAKKDIELALRLIQNRHLSPTEHVATPDYHPVNIGNFVGWIQYRKSIKAESGE